MNDSTPGTVMGFGAEALTGADPGRRYATLTLARGALTALAITLVVGLLGVFYTVPSVGVRMRELGVDFTALRPLHTGFAAAWVFLGGLTAVHRYLQEQAGPMTGGDRWRLRVQLVCWAVAGLGILVTLPLGITSGREYMGHHPWLSVPILVGWLAFTWNFFRVVGPGFFSRPIYVTMWGVGCLFFLYTFTEQHLWLLEGVFGDPVVDRRIQWKATGTLVGSFNLFMYGALVYAWEKLTGDDSYGHSRLAYALFGVGLLNSFTNFAHHTYHLPQSHAVKWIAFVVSMTELILFFRVVQELLISLRGSERMCPDNTRLLLISAKWWTAAMVFSSVLISIPPLNALVHGTYAIAGHAMGTMIGIDTFVLLGVLIALLGEIMDAREGVGAAQRLEHPAIRRTILGMNVATAALVGWLTLVGCLDG
ncbi:MAG: cbb3-type cytochrome c oxidase subunit I, partial [Myxococcota bacterium]|nr:cbb3-type cytochrome c oxidase subunit I [Myxococcota bacterium]